MLRMLLAVVSLSLVAPVPAVDLAGTWNVVIPAGSQKRPDGSTAAWKEMRGTLSITRKDAELRATWRTIDEWTMTGRADAEGRFALDSDERNGARWSIRGAPDGAALSGTALVVFGGREPIRHTWTATRRQGSD